LTHNAKAVFLKSKRLPLIAYPVQIYPLPAQIRQEITNSISSPVIPNRNTRTPEKPRWLCNLNIAFYSDIFYLKSITAHCKHRKEETVLTDEMTSIEYNIGLQLSKLFAIPCKNRLADAAMPSRFYSCAVAYCRKYGLTFEEMYVLRTRTIN